MFAKYGIVNKSPQPHTNNGHQRICSISKMSPFLFKIIKLINCYTKYYAVCKFPINIKIYLFLFQSKQLDIGLIYFTLSQLNQTKTIEKSTDSNSQLMLTIDCCCSELWYSIRTLLLWNSYYFDWFATKKKCLKISRP